MKTVAVILSVFLAVASARRVVDLENLHPPNFDPVIDVPTSTTDPELAVPTNVVRADGIVAKRYNA